VAALLGLRPRITYEGQAAIELEAAATGVPLDAVPAYPAAVEDQGKMLVIDPSPLVARVVAERDHGTPVAAVSAGFHAGLGRAAVDAAVELAGRHGLDTVALSGGVFQNTRLTEVVVEACREAGLSVLVHQRVPPNDGGISIGQAAIAALSD
jgi:hydrogenase maturation protein HypF